MSRLWLQAVILAGFTFSAAHAQFADPDSFTGGTRVGASGLGWKNSLLNPDSSQVFLTGKVTTADGSPLSGSVGIERLCGAGQRVVAYTDGSGRFGFQWAGSAGVLPDVSESLAVNARVSTGCELRAVLPGFYSDSINLDGRWGMEDPFVGTIVLHRLPGVEGLSVSATALRAPQPAKKAYDKGLQALHRGKIAEAGKNLERAVTIYPAYANAWLDLGKIRLQTQSADAAEEAFQKALAADDKLVEAHIQMGMLAAKAQRWKDAATHFDTSLRLDPVDFPHVWFADAVANYNIRNLGQAEKSVQEARKLDSRYRSPDEERLFRMILAARRVETEDRQTAESSAKK